MSEESLESIGVLVVEDEPFSAQTLTTALENLGIESVTAASNGSDALAVLEAPDVEFDIIICDIEMPEMTGYEFVRRLRYGVVPRFKDIPVLMLTGHDSPKNLRRARTHKIDGFLVKPPNADLLRRSILDALKD